MAAPDPSTSNGLPSLVAAAAEPKRRRTDGSPDDARRMFQRIWTEPDEIAILEGFLAFTDARRRSGALPAHHDTGLFYDQFRASLRLDVNKSQLVEKLRRLKKKYRNAAARVAAGKDTPFKTAHDQAAFHLCAKIWGAPVEEDDDDVIRRPRPPYLSPTPISSLPAAHGAAADAKWRRQQILELEVLSQRIDLIQEQIKLQLADLKRR